MGLYERPELHEKRDGETQAYKLINEIRRVTVGALGEATALDPATTTGFATAPVVHGVPLDPPDQVQGDRVPWVIDDTDMRAYFYVNGAWRYAQLV